MLFNALLTALMNSLNILLYSRDVLLVFVMKLSGISCSFFVSEMLVRNWCCCCLMTNALQDALQFYRVVLYFGNFYQLFWLCD